MTPLTELGLATGFDRWSGARPVDTSTTFEPAVPFEPEPSIEATGLPGGPLGSPGPDYTPGTITDPYTDVPRTPGPTGPGIERPTLPPDAPEFPGTPTPPEVPPIQTPGTPVTDIPGTGPEASA